MGDMIPTYRVVTFVPADQAETFIEKLSPHIPVFTGNYDHVLWWSEPGTEQFRKKGDSEPPEKVSSIRVEFSMQRDNVALQKIIAEGIRPNHPWKEPVILIFEGNFNKH